MKIAREQRDKARLSIKGGTDPSLTGEPQRQQVAADAARTFKAVALDWHKKLSLKWTPEHADINLV